MFFKYLINVSIIFCYILFKGNFHIINTINCCSRLIIVIKYWPLFSLYKFMNVNKIYFINFIYNMFIYNSVSWHQKITVCTKLLKISNHLLCPYLQKLFITQSENLHISAQNLVLEVYVLYTLFKYSFRLKNIFLRGRHSRGQ